MEHTVLITGASRGIGAQTARLFAQQGWRVAVGYNQSEQQACALVQELSSQGCRALAVQADVSDRRQVRAMVARVNLHLGRIGALVNNAGMAQQKLFLEITPEEWDRMFQVHVKGMYHCAQEVLRQMIDAQEGSIVNISSVWGQTGGSCEVHYSAAKAAVIGFTKALAKEMGLSGVRVNCVAPGVIDTEMNGALSPPDRQALCEQTPLGRLGTPGEVAQAVFFLASERASFITGQVISPNGGFVI